MPTPPPFDDFQLSLEYVRRSEHCHIFRLAFGSSAERFLLPYPQVTGLHFLNDSGERISEWQSRFLISSPLDEFVLNPTDRIAFDLQAHINVESDQQYRWTIDLPTSQINVQYHYKVDSVFPSYDYLAKRSRFVAITKPWLGTVRSNVIQLQLPTKNVSPESAA